MILTESNGKHRDKANAPHALANAEGGEVAYSSVSVMDDAAKDALSQVKPPLTNHHG